MIIIEEVIAQRDRVYFLIKVKKHPYRLRFNNTLFSNETGKWYVNEIFSNDVILILNVHNNCPFEIMEEKLKGNKMCYADEFFKD